MAKATMEARNMAKKYAALDLLLAKKPVEQEVTIYAPGPDGSTELVLLFRAIGSAAYDKLLESSPPTRVQKEDGQSYDPNKFCPRLIAACSVEPKLTEEQAEQIWTSESWNRSEVSKLFSAAVEVCMAGADPNPTVSG